MFKTSDLSRHPIIYGTRAYFYIFINSKHNIDAKITKLYNNLMIYFRYIELCYYETYKHLL